jgi:hypothetical protein
LRRPARLQFDALETRRLQSADRASASSFAAACGQVPLSFVPNPTNHPRSAHPRRLGRLRRRSTGLGLARLEGRTLVFAALEGPTKDKADGASRGEMVVDVTNL